jgi:CSLREA domain-containing protein
MIKRIHFLSTLARWALVFTLITAAVVGVLPTPVVHAATTRTINVDNVDDNNPGGGCTLREAITLANAGAGVGTFFQCKVTEDGGLPPLPVAYVINLPSYTYTLNGAAGDDGNASGDLDISANMIINGTGKTIINGGGIDRVFHIDPAGIGGLSVSISGVTIQKGNVDPNDGGGIYNNGSKMNIANSTFTDNEADEGGGIYNTGNGTVTIANSTLYTNTARFGGGIGNDGGTVAIVNSTFDDNEAERGGGGICSWTGAVTVTNSTFSNNRAVTDPGGGIYKDGSAATITGSNFYSNTGRFGGGIRNKGLITITNSILSYNKVSRSGGAIYNPDGLMTITHCTIANNEAVESGGGIYNEASGAMNIAHSTLSDNQTGRYGGGIISTAPITISNTTLSGNKADIGGGGIYNTDSADLTNVTITNNTANNDNDASGDGGGIYNDGGGTINLKNTIVAGNFDTPGNAGPAPIYPDITGNNINGNAYNLIGNMTGSGAGTVGTGSDIVNPTPGLDLLADNGGDTQTHALLSGSPAIDAVPLVGCILPSDQRGVSRPQGDSCDIGAYEAEPISVYLPLVLK